MAFMRPGVRSPSAPPQNQLVSGSRFRHIEKCDSFVMVANFSRQPVQKVDGFLFALPGKVGKSKRHGHGLLTK
jgi:hypothetical protein